jgi:hypothetical protein
LQLREERLNQKKKEIEELMLNTQYEEEREPKERKKRSVN